MTIKIVLIYISAGILLASCTTTEANEIIPDVKLPDVDNEKIIVEAIKVEKQNFYKEIKCNGKISAKRKAELQFEIEGKLNNIYVTNGEKIKKGMPIARLDSFILRNRLEHKQISLQIDEISKGMQVTVFPFSVDTIGYKGKIILHDYTISHK